MLAPGIQPKQFEESFGLLRILIQPPPPRSVSQAALSKLAHQQLESARRFSGATRVFDGDENRTIFKIRLKIRVGVGPVGGRPQVDRLVNDQREEPDESQTQR